MSSASLESAEPKATSAGEVWIKRVAILSAALLVGGLLYQFGGPLEFVERLAERESDLRALQQRSPLLVIGAAFLVYALVTGLAVPGAAVLTLLTGWFFGPLVGTVLVSFASTTGATIAFLLSRHFGRDFVRRRFGSRVKRFDEAVEREGAFYLFTLRLVPAVPFFVLNAVMGLTRLRTTTFWWVSQLGMLPGTLVYVYAGSRVPDLETLARDGAGAVFSGPQLLQLTLALGLLGVFPLVAKKVVDRFCDRSDGKVETASASPAEVSAA